MAIQGWRTRHNKKFCFDSSWLFNHQKYLPMVFDSVILLKHRDTELNKVIFQKLLCSIFLIHTISTFELKVQHHYNGMTNFEN